MIDIQPELISELKKLTAEELYEHFCVYDFIRKISSTLGVLVIFCMFVFPNSIVIPIGCGVVYSLLKGNLAVTEIIRIIREMQTSKK